MSKICPRMPLPPLADFLPLYTISVLSTDTSGSVGRHSSSCKPGQDAESISCSASPYLRYYCAQYVSRMDYGLNTASGPRLSSQLQHDAPSCLSLQALCTCQAQACQMSNSPCWFPGIRKIHSSCTTQWRPRCRCLLSTLLEPALHGAVSDPP